MDTEEFENFEKDMEPFDVKDHRRVAIYLDHLNTKGWTIEDTRAYIIIKSERRVNAIIELTSATLKCPECQTAMRLLPVNVDRTTLTGDDSKSVWLCPNMSCMYAEYSVKTTEEWITELDLTGT